MLKACFMFFPLFLLAQTSLMTQDDSIYHPVPPANAEPTHIYFTLGDNREVPFILKANEKMENNYRYDFVFEPHWKVSQVFVRLSGMPGPYHFQINHFILS